MATIDICGQPQPFTEEQKQRIGTEPSAGIMRLWLIDNETDSLLLREESTDFTAEDLRSDYFSVLQTRMLATVRDPSNPGVGIAAPQVGILKRGVFVQRLDKAGEPFEFYVNPRIEAYSEQLEVGPEGCLSIPSHSGMVPRSVAVKVSYLNTETTERSEEIVSGFTAVIFQHEIDHLDGVLYIDREVALDEESGDENSTTTGGNSLP